MREGKNIGEIGIQVNWRWKKDIFYWDERDPVKGKETIQWGGGKKSKKSNHEATAIKGGAKEGRIRGECNYSCRARKVKNAIHVLGNVGKSVNGAGKRLKCTKGCLFKKLVVSGVLSQGDLLRREKKRDWPVLGGGEPTKAVKIPPRPLMRRGGRTAAWAASLRRGVV